MRHEKNIAAAAIVFLIMATITTVGWADEICMPTAVATTTTPVPSPNETFANAARNLAENPPPKADIAIVGDSVAAGFRWFQDELFPRKLVFNFGAGGDRTENVLWRLNAAEPRSAQPRAVVVMVGTNNLSSASLPACSIAAGRLEVVMKVKQVWPKAVVFVVDITPRGGDFHFRNDDRLEINKELVTSSSGLRGVITVTPDEQELTCGQYELMSGDLGQTRRCENYKDDNLHFVGLGYLKLRRALASKSVEVLGSDVFE